MVTVSRGYCSDSFRTWEATEPVQEPVQSDTCIMEAERSAPPMTVAKALREHCHVPFESYFLAAHLGGGKFAYFAGSNPMSEDDIRKVFRRDKFLQFQHRATIGNGITSTGEDCNGFDEGHAARNGQYFEEQWPMESRRRKRPRRQQPSRRGLDDTAPCVISSSKKGIEIGDSKALRDFYERRFKCMQQTACKEIGKAFIKVICPKKQATHPYTGGWDMRPDWWPEPWGRGEKERARHIEPDHQWKEERVRVLIHILRLIIEPERQPPSIRKLGGITVAKLEAAAMEALSSWFQDPARPKNARKKPILKELFKVAKMEERYKRNEIDAGTQVYVTADDMVMDYCFDPDDEEDEDQQRDESPDATAERARTASIASSHVSPTQSTTMPALPGLSPTGTQVHALSTQFQATQFMHEMPMRANQYAAPGMLPSDLATEPYSYADGLQAQAHTTASLQLHDMLTASPHHAHQDATRRSSSLFTTPTTEFSGPSPSTMYHSPWSQSPQPQGTPTTAASSPGTASPLYAYTHQHPQHHAHQQHQQQQSQQQTALPTLPLPMPVTHHHQQHQPQTTTTASAYAGHYAPSGYYALSQMHHQQGHQSQQHHQHHQQAVFRAGSVQIAMQSHPHHQGHHQAAAVGGHGQGR